MIAKKILKSKICLIFVHVDDDSSKATPNVERNHEDRYINTLMKLLEKQRDNDVTLFLPNDRSMDSPKPALYYYVSISLLLQDKELDETLNYMLHEKCCKNDMNFFGSSICSESMADKRNTIKKVKFHSWGGKRSGSNSQVNSRSPANIDLSKDIGQSKIVIRTPFRPWGGKRSN